MFISTRGRYALRVIIDLADNNDGKLVPMKDVASRQNISLKYLEQILPILTKNGIVQAVHGKGGGYKFNMSPDECSVWDILRLTEGDLSPVSCLGENAKECDRAAECRTLSMWKGLNDVLREYLQSVKISDLLDNNVNCDNYII